MKPLRVALSGCGFRLPAHVGALQAIQDGRRRIIELAGTSGGAIVAALYACGMSLVEMRQICLEMDWSPMMGLSCGSILSGRGLSSGNRMLSFLMDCTRGKTFAQVSIDLRIIAADLMTEREFVFDRQNTPDVPVALAARASASIPIVYEAVRYDGHVLVDGGTTDNMPASNLIVDDVPRFGVYLDTGTTPLAPGRSRIWDLGPRIIDLMLSSNELTHMTLDQDTGAQIVHVPTGYASSFDRRMPRGTRLRLYKDGKDAVAKALAA
ncbi:patatin-like phospholipase family protein [Candidimonas humi]|uniref:Patatin-like phospholipase family protein n=1 Tax=Candidimonas humi TaxID=683355 RepID=A0ABV8NVX1_9BURK|nr:patatin-like phospholipase family protein [Candidimonas humi]MBV6304955.1 patatin-like phospholipase family protein [Candidimonas humi]